MPSEWVRRGDGSLGEGKDLSDIEFKPEEFEKKLTTSFKTQLDEMQTKQNESMKPLLDMAASIAAEKTEKVEAARVAAAKKTAETNEVTMEDFMLDPEDAMRRKLEPTNRALMMLAARGALREQMEDKEYYHGDMKSKIDALVSTLPLAQQTNAASIENCYKIVVYDHQKDITDGKIKARNTAAIFAGDSTGGHSGKESSDSGETLSADEKLVASRMGISDKDWISSRKELTYV